ncbi:MAG: pseudouridine synthase [Patescibacteria group bacterium]|nr:pseudouridine synthase [Patescibacteria group bacterium]
MEYPIRLNKYLRDMGLASRRESDRLIESGHVLVNGKKAKLGTMVNEGDDVSVREGVMKEMIYLAYYKPWGIATQGLKGQPSVINEWQPRGLFPVGRLDKESEGLLILTNDGRITSKLLGDEETFEKEYIVEVREKLRSGIPAIFEKGMQTDLGQLLPAQAKILNDHRLDIILHEGKKHQIRVMLSELGYTVSLLKRVRIGNIKLGNLTSGQTRNLNKKEVDLLFAE